MDLLWLSVLRLLRRGWRSTVFVALLAGLAGGITMATWAAARRTDSAFERRLTHAAIPELQLNMCPPHVTSVDQDSIQQCFSYRPTEEAELLRTLPEVADVAVIAFRGVTVAPADERGRTVSASQLASTDPAIHSTDGQQELVEGRWYEPGRTGEIVLSEQLRDRLGVEVGERVELTYWSPEEMGTMVADGEWYAGPSSEATVVGVARGILDLTASASATALDEVRGFQPYDIASPAAPIGEFTGVVVRARPGSEGDLSGAIDRALSGRLYNSTQAMGPDDLEPIREAIDYEAIGALVLGGLMATAASVFVAQAVARQSRREWADLDTFRAIGVTHRQARSVAALRGGATGLLAASLAVTVAILLSPLGPLGLARRADPVRGVKVDVPVISTGALAVVILVAIAGTFGIRPRAETSTRARASARATARSQWMPAPALAGIRMAESPRQARAGLPVGAALGGLAAAVALSVAAAGLISSLESLHRHPDRYGAPWDLSLGGTYAWPESARATLEHLRAQGQVAAAAEIVGSDVELLTAGGERVVVWAQAFAPLEGFDRTISPPVLSGRAPAGGDEIALGTITMADLGVEPGDTLRVRTTTSQSAAVPMTVVGTTIVNDNFESSPGRGAVVTEAWVRAGAPEATPDPTVIQFVPGTDVTAARAAIEARYEGDVLDPIPQGAIRNVDRIRGLPIVLSAVVGLLALTSLAHALLLSVRRNRRPLAVLRSLGFTRRQVVAAVATHATSLALVGIGVGAPLGLLLGRWGWRSITTQIGVVEHTVTPILPIVLVMAAAAVTANVVALLPGWRSARTPTADALRTE